MRSLLTLWKKGIEEHEERYHFSGNRIIIPGPSRTPSGYLIQASFSYAPNKTSRHSVSFHSTRDPALIRHPMQYSEGYPVQTHT
jgi:hypothetical protein